jgi:hypothetical protein
LSAVLAPFGAFAARGDAGHSPNFNTEIRLRHAETGLRARADMKLAQDGPAQDYADERLHGRFVDRARLRDLLVEWSSTINTRSGTSNTPPLTTHI